MNSIGNLIGYFASKYITQYIPSLNLEQIRIELISGHVHLENV